MNFPYKRKRYRCKVSYELDDFSDHVIIQTMEMWTFHVKLFILDISARRKILHADESSEQQQKRRSFLASGRNSSREGDNKRLNGKKSLSRVIR